MLDTILRNVARFWWITPLILAAFCLTTLGHVVPIMVYSGHVMVGLFILSFVVVCIQIYEKKKQDILLHLSLLAICMYTLFFLIPELDTLPDKFADNLVQPSVPYAKVIGRPHEENPIPTECDAEKLLLYYGPKPGAYRATMCMNMQEAGMLYIRAYETSTNRPLSAYNVKTNTSVAVPANDPSLLATPTFFISEGDPGKFYLARFEIWFAPASGGAEQKVLEKVFQIEGGV